MALFHEKRLDNTLDVGDIGVGETVEVRTLMGIPKVCGEVTGSTPLGLIVKEEGGHSTFYQEGLHLFAVIEPDVVTRIGNVLTDMDPDQRVEMKLRSIGEKDDDLTGGGAKKLDKGFERGDDDDSDKDKDDDKDDKDDDDKKEKEKPKKKKEPEASDSVVDPDALPDDIQKAIISTEQMDEAQLNGVLGEISESVVKSLKRAGVKETEIFSTAQKIQDAVHKILTGKKQGK
jgi:hypothetical protein